MVLIIFDYYKLYGIIRVSIMGNTATLEIPILLFWFLPHQTDANIQCIPQLEHK